MDHGTVLGDANKKPVAKISPVMHCQRRYYQASCAIPKWLILLERRESEGQNDVMSV